MCSFIYIYIYILLPHVVEMVTLFGPPPLVCALALCDIFGLDDIHFTSRDTLFQSEKTLKRENREKIRFHHFDVSLARYKVMR